MAEVVGLQLVAVAEEEVVAEAGEMMQALVPHQHLELPFRSVL